MVVYQELKYRTLDQLVDACRIDLKAFSIDGNIEMQEIIKIAQECNYDMGLAIHQNKETILEIEHGTTKLPADFQFLNFALLCHDFKVVTPGPNSGNMRIDTVTSIQSPNITTCPCWSVICAVSPMQTKVLSCEGEQLGLTFFPNDDGSAKETKVCAQYIDVSGAGGSGTLTATSSSFCFNDENTGTLTCDQPINCGCSPNQVDTCAVVNADPNLQNKVYTICDNTIGIKVMQICTTEIRQYEHFAPVYMTSNRQASAFMNPARHSMNTANQAMLNNGFMKFAIPCGRVYINYMGTLEDDDGNLLVLDHPKINSYYEWAIKKRIILNLYINGEANLERRLQLVDAEYVKAKISALTIANTPDHRVMQETFQIIRKNAMQRFAAPVSRFYGRFAGVSFIDQYANRRFAE